MKLTTLLLTLTCTMMFLIAGCSGNNNAETKETPTTKPVETPAPTAVPEETTEPTVQPTEIPDEQKAPVLTLTGLSAFLKEANRLDSSFYIDKSYTLEEIYAHYAPYCTKNYVDNMVMKNMKKDGDRYILAYMESEIAEATYFDPNLSSDAKLEQNDDIAVVTNTIGDGLYAPHQEMTTLIYTDDGWKIDDVKWEYTVQTQ